MIALALLLATPVPVPPAPTTRILSQVAGDWRAEYTFANFNPSTEPMTLAPADVALTLDGWLSNSRSPDPARPSPHATPRHAAHRIDLSAGPSSTADVVPSENAATRCREVAHLLVWAAPPDTPGLVPMDPVVPADDAPAKPVVVPPGGTLHIRILLNHDHEVHGIDPLLGRRALSLTLGGPALRDTLDLTREQFVHRPDRDWNPMFGLPADFRDDRQWSSPPDSLILDAWVPGRQYYRFPERKVRPGARMRLRLRYLVLPGLDGTLKARVAQYRVSPDAWKVLDGGFERPLPGATDRGRPAARWMDYEEVFTTHPEATAMALDLRIADAEAGVCWIDDLSLDYVARDREGNP